MLKKSLSILLHYTTCWTLDNQCTYHIHEMLFESGGRGGGGGGGDAVLSIQEALNS